MKPTLEEMDKAYEEGIADYHCGGKTFYPVSTKLWIAYNMGKNWEAYRYAVCG